MAKQLDKSFEKEGVSIIPVCGKTNLDRPYLIFKSLGISCYLIFDGDKNEECQKDKRHPEKNRALLHLLGKTEEDYPNTACWPEGACFLVNLQDEIRRQIGPEVYSAVMTAVLAEFDLEKQADGEKNPGVMAEVLKRCAEKGKKAEILEQIIYAILEVHGKND